MRATTTRPGAAAKSTVRTSAGALRFWTQTTRPAWFQARQLSTAKGLGLAENARLYALLSMSLANAFITDWDAKFLYNSWRPVTAIRNGDMDGNNATERDVSWTPLNATPMHPEYPSQAGINVGASVGVLESVFGTGPNDFTATDIADPRLQRQFTSIAQMGKEQCEVRVWGGVHFRNSPEVGEGMGHKIAGHLIGNYMTPNRRPE